MATLIPIVIVILMIVVAIILALGLANMVRGGNVGRSQKLMRYRVLAQFIAVLAMVGALLYFGRG